jgi:hypothetical protein
MECVNSAKAAQAAQAAQAAKAAQAAMSFAPIDILDVTQRGAAKERFDRDGVVVMRLLSEEECARSIFEIWDTVITKQPWKPGIRLELPGGPGGALATEDLAAFARAVTGPFTPQRRKQLECGWPFHSGFGAPCDDNAFHLRGSWEVRQNPKLYGLAAALTGTTDLWVDINRPIAKLPGKGEEELLHWDLNPFAAAAGAAAAAASPTQIGGKVCYTDASFICVPGTHRPEFLSEFARIYAPIYPRVTARSNVPKFGLDQTKDPLGLFARCVTIDVPAGCVVLWSTRLLHGTVASPKDGPAQYGAYVGFFEAVRGAGGAGKGPSGRPEYRAKCGVDELDDRLASYVEDRAPLLWPSFDKIHFYPKRFQNFPNILQGYINKMPLGHESITTRMTKGAPSKPPRQVPHITPWPKSAPKGAWAPFALSPLGRKLLGTDPWPPAHATFGQTGTDDDDCSDSASGAKRRRLL